MFICQDSFIQNIPTLVSIVLSFCPLVSFIQKYDFNTEKRNLFCKYVFNFRLSGRILNMPPGNCCKFFNKKNLQTVHN